MLGAWRLALLGVYAVVLLCLNLQVLQAWGGAIRQPAKMLGLWACGSVVRPRGPPKKPKTRRVTCCSTVSRQLTGFQGVPDLAPGKTEKCPDTRMYVLDASPVFALSAKVERVSSSRHHLSHT